MSGKIRKDLTNIKFGHLTALYPTDLRGPNGDVIWNCVCDCGNTKLVSSKLLLAKSTKSCGCKSTYKIDPNRVTKCCPKCKTTKSIDEFPKNKNNKDKHHTYCKPCTAIRNKINGKKYASTINKYLTKKYHSNLNFRITHSQRTRMGHAIRNNQKFGKTLDLLGCSIEELKLHMSKKFTEGMSWDNYGKYWEIDHIKPCSLFDLSKEDEQRKCFHFTNLQPLLPKENRQKGNKYEG